jgi:hypothetical protein
MSLTMVQRMERVGTKTKKKPWERLTLDKNEIQLEIAQVMRMRRLQLWLFTSHPLYQGSSTTCPMMMTPLTLVLDCVQRLLSVSPSPNTVADIGATVRPLPLQRRPPPPPLPS